MRRQRGNGLGKGRFVVTSIAVSGFGTWCYNVGIAVYAYDRTHSTGWVAAVTVGRYLPALVLSWLAAALLDRLPRRGLVVGADLLCAAVMLALAALAGADAPLWLLTGVAALSSTAARVQAAGVLALAADVVVESQLPRTTRYAAAAEAVATAAGSGAASLLLSAFTAPTLFVVNAFTFAVSGALVARLRGVPVRQQHRPAMPARETGVASRIVWPLQVTRGLVACVYGFDVVLLTVVATRHAGGGSGRYGWLLAAAGIGGLIALLPARSGAGGSRTAEVASAGLVLYALPLLLFILPAEFAGQLGTQVVRGVGSVLASSCVIGALQRAVPSAVAGRVFATTQSLVLAGTCVGAVATPLLLKSVGFDATVVLGAAVPCLVQLAMHPTLVRFDRVSAPALAALDPRVTLLRQLDLLRDASRATLYEIADSIVERVVPAGAEIVRAGDEAHSLFVLVDGEVAAFAPDGSAPRLLRTMQAPAYFGEIGIMRAVPRTASAAAQTNCVLWEVPADAFLNATAQAGISGALIETLQVRIRATPQPAAAAPTH